MKKRTDKVRCPRCCHGPKWTWSPGIIKMLSGEMSTDDREEVECEACEGTGWKGGKRFQPTKTPKYKKADKKLDALYTQREQLEEEFQAKLERLELRIWNQEEELERLANRKRGA